MVLDQGPVVSWQAGRRERFPLFANVKDMDIHFPSAVTHEQSARYHHFLATRTIHAVIISFRMVLTKRTEESPALGRFSTTQWRWLFPECDYHA